MSFTTNDSDSKNIKRTSAYLKRRASRLRRKSALARDNSERDGLLFSSERALNLANELYFASC